MINFGWPLLFFLLPLPALLYYLLPVSKKQQSAALIVPDLEDFSSFNTPTYRFTGAFFWFFLAWTLLIIAAARPQWAGPTVEIPKSGRDLMLAVDLSASMQTQDFKIKGKYTDRLTALKFIVSDFIERRKGDRIGLILFGSNAYLQAPLTFDTTTVKQFLQESQVGFAGNATAIGDAIGLAVKQLKSSAQKSKVLILLTDGSNNAGELTPQKAAEIAAKAQLKIHTVAIGSNKIPSARFFGMAATSFGNEIDEKTLQLIAEKSGGNYFRAYHTKELSEIYRYIDQLESIKQTHQRYRPVTELYFWPALAALLILTLFILHELNFKRG